MKRGKIFFCIVLTYLFALSCTKQDAVREDSELFSRMVTYSQHYADLLQNSDFTGTKAALALDNFNSVDRGILDQKFVDYIDVYTEPEDISLWDERAILDIVEQDSRFSESEKVAFAESIAFGYFIKDNPGIVLDQTAPTASQCYANYQKAIRRAAEVAILTLAGGLLEPTIAAETIALLIYAQSMIAAEEDLNDCLAQINNQ